MTREGTSSDGASKFLCSNPPAGPAAAPDAPQPATGAAGGRPEPVYVWIAALGYFHASNRYTLSAMLETDLTAPRALQARPAYATAMALAYLHDIPPAPRARMARRLP